MKFLVTYGKQTLERSFILVGANNLEEAKFYASKAFPELVSVVNAKRFSHQELSDRFTKYFS